MAQFGIASVTYEYAISVDVEGQAEVKKLLSKQGYLVEGYIPEKTFKISVKGHGATCPVGIGYEESSGVAGFTSGVFVCDSVKQTETNEDWPTWEYSGTVYPNAVPG